MTERRIKVTTPEGDPPVATTAGALVSAMWKMDKDLRALARDWAAAGPERAACALELLHLLYGEERALKYGDGPWLDEPDHVEFEHAGFLCVLHRVPSLGTWCGYVGVVDGHPWFEKGYDDVDADVHGGLTYSEMGRGRLGQPDDAPHWFLGFDCAHDRDLVPQVAMLSPGHAKGNTYRDIAYARRQTERLARQAQAAALTREPDEEQAP